MLTETKLREYVMNPTKCPYCDQDTLIGSFMEAEGAFMRNSVECENPDCKKTFIEIFRLVGIAEPKDGTEGELEEAGSAETAENTENKTDDEPEKPKLVLV